MKEIKISEIEGFRIGHEESENKDTGCTAIICEKGAFAGVDVRGGGPASRETDLLRPENMVQQIHCVMLSGGSAYGLASADGAMAYLEEKGVGFDVDVAVVPIVCGASLFDLTVGDPKVRPDKEMGYKACVNSEKNNPEEGNKGAGAGATIGKYLGLKRRMKSGLGMYAVSIGDVKIGAIVAVNALGDVRDVDTGKPLGGILSEDGQSLDSTLRIMEKEIGKGRNVFLENTTLGCIITNGKLNKDQANKMAQIAHTGLARVINPVHTSADGDTIFVMSTGEKDVNADALSAISADVLARAINRAVMKAEPAFGLKASRDFK